MLLFLDFRSTLEAKYIEDKLTPRLILPLSLSYDHRVIDGAESTRFMNHLTSLLENPFFLCLGISLGYIYLLVIIKLDKLRSKFF